MKAISKYFMFAAAALLCAMLLSSCSKETSNPAGEDDASSSVCFGYSIFAIEGNLPDVKSSTGVSYADFLAKIKTGGDFIVTLGFCHGRLDRVSPRGQQTSIRLRVTVFNDLWRCCSVICNIIVRSFVKSGFRIC